MLKDQPSIRLSDDQDLLDLVSFLDDGNGNGHWPRRDARGNEKRSWDRYHREAVDHIESVLRARKDTAEPFEIGRLDPRSLMRLRRPARFFALHFLYQDADRPGDDFYSSKAAYYWRMGADALDQEAVQLDYDLDRSGDVDLSERNQPFPARLIRG